MAILLINVMKMKSSSSLLMKSLCTKIIGKTKKMRRKKIMPRKDYPCVCKFCGGAGDKRYRGYCQSCYRYFITENKKLYPLYDPAKGPQYAPNGDCICPLCGKAFTKLG